MKILYFDVETTGTNPKENEITQFAAIVEIDGVVKEEVNFRCRPTNLANIDPQALEVTGMTIDKLMEAPEPSVMASQIKRLLDKYINKFSKTDKFYPAGHNVQFDLDFLQSFWKKHIDQFGSGSYQNWRSLDSRVFGNFLAAAGKLETGDMKLETLANHFQIEINAHDALSDIRATRQIIKKMMSFL